MILTAQRQELRCRILKVLDAQRPRAIADSILLRVLLEQHQQTTAEELKTELGYLAEKRLVWDTTSDRTFMAALTAHGVDVVEGTTECPPGIDLRCFALSQSEHFRCQEIRWRFLAVCNAGRPQPIQEMLMLRALEDINLNLTANELRREACYLAEKGLIECRKPINPENPWSFSLTVQGVDVVDYSVDCPAGINRPEKYWD